jgi:YHS domain-containing protein
MRKAIILVVAVFAVAAFAALAGGCKSEEHKDMKMQTMCPVMGGPINRACYEDYKDKRVYFCHEACKAEFKKDPEKYMKKMESEGVKCEEMSMKPQTLCPVMKAPINKKYYVDYNKQRIYFCCSDCPKEFNKDPGKYMKALKEWGVTPEPAPNS